MPAIIPDQLKEIANHINQGGERSETVTNASLMV